MATLPGTRTLARAVLRERDAPSARPKGPRLVPDGGPAAELRDGLVIGRGRTSGVRLRQLEVSRVHAAIVATGDGWAVEDRSKNGVRVNGRAVRGRAGVGPGDVLTVGRARLRLVDGGEEAPSPPARPPPARPRGGAASARGAAGRRAAAAILALAVALAILAAA